MWALSKLTLQPFMTINGYTVYPVLGLTSQTAEGGATI